MLAFLSPMGGMSVMANEKAVAKVNDEVITEQDMAQAETELFHSLAELPEKMRRKVLVDYLIQTRLLAKAAEAAKLTETKQYKSQVAYFERHALRDAFFRQKIMDAVTDADVKKFYDDESKVIDKSVSHILVKEEAKAKELRSKALKGGDFAALAKEHSIDPGSKSIGGKIGYIRSKPLVPTFMKAADALKKKGDISEPIKTPFGWHIIRLDETRNQVLPPYKDVKTRIHDHLRQQKANKIVGDLKSKAKVEYIDKELSKSLEELRGSN